MLDQQTFEKLCTNDWEQIILDLTLYAGDKLRMLSIAGVELPPAHEPIDYAKEAVRLLFEGQRSWNEEKYPDVAKFLKYSIIKSLIYNDRVSRSVKMRLRAKVHVKGNYEDEEELEFSEIIPSDEPPADSVIIEQQTLQSIRLALADDYDAALIFEELIQSKKPREITKDLGITIEDVRNILKRVRRKVTAAIS